MTILTRTLSLLLAAPLLPLVLTAGPARADVQPCTVSYTTGGSAISPYAGTDGGHALTSLSLAVSDTRVVTDIDMTVDLAKTEVNKLTISLLSPQTKSLAPNIFFMTPNMVTGSMEGVYTFDEEVGAAKIAGLNPVPATYRSGTAESELEGHPANGSWTLWLLNQSAQAGQIRSFTLTLTYATCDSDGDGTEDSVDNCLTVPNDQANHDDDSLGDACDLDMDGDNIVNADDGCPLISASTATGCPTAQRTATLRPAKRGKRLKFTVRSSAPGCISRAEVTLWRARRGKDLKVLTATTTTRGRYRTKTPRQRGKYYFLVASSYAPGQAECDPATSPSRKVRR